MPETLELQIDADGSPVTIEPWWHRLLSATIPTAAARKFLIWGARGDVLAVREAVPGKGSQVRGWMTCAALASYLLLREPGVCRVDLSALLADDDAKLDDDSLAVVGCDACAHGAPKPPGASKPFCMKCGRDLAPRSKWAGSLAIWRMSRPRSSSAEASISSGDGTRLTD